LHYHFTLLFIIAGQVNLDGIHYSLDQHPLTNRSLSN